MTGPIPSMAALSFCSCSPMLWSFCGLGVRSLASVLRALRRPFLPGRGGGGKSSRSGSGHAPSCCGRSWLRPPHLLAGTACWAACWSSRTETSARPRPPSSCRPSLVRTCTPRNSGAWTGAGPAPSLAPPPRLIDRDALAQKIKASGLTQRSKPQQLHTHTHTHPSHDGLLQPTITPARMKSAKEVKAAST